MKIDDKIRDNEEPVLMNYSTYSQERASNGPSNVNVLKVEK